MVKISNNILGIVYIISYLCLLYCLWLWNGPTFLFFDIYFLGSSLVDNNPSLIRYMDIYKLEIPGFDWLCGKSIEQLLSLFGS